MGQLRLSVGEVGEAGPLMLVTAGVHGDEGPWGAWAIRLLLDRVPADQLRGRLRVIPVANPLAMQADARNAPVDQLDLNRSFPGSADGSYTERLAAAIVAQGLPDAQYVIDLHGGGSWCVNAFAFLMEGGEMLSHAFRAPFIASAPDRSVTLSGYARSQGAVVAGIEMGGRSEDEEQWAERIAGGLYRAMIAAGILAEGELFADPGTEAIPVGSTTVLRPASGGVFIPVLRAAHVGTIVPKGTLLGHIIDPTTQQIIESFHAPFEQTAIMLLRPMIAQIEGGAMTYVVAQPR